MSQCLCQKKFARKKAAYPSQPSFKPRKINKQTESKYRDRAAERRVGEGNDYAQVWLSELQVCRTSHHVSSYEVEAVLEDFERRTAQNEDKIAVSVQFPRTTPLFRLIPFT
jgi:hypothetical protein